MTRSFRLLAALLVTALLALVGGSPAHADPQRLLLSMKQTGPFTESLSTPLFTGTYVPGTATSTFYVKNDSSSTTRATIALVPKDAVNDFERALSFSATVGGQSGTAVPLYQDKKKNECRTIVTGPTVNPGGVQRIDVTMLIDPNLSRAAMKQSASFTFVVTLSQVTNKGKVDVCGAQSPGGSVQVLGAQANAAFTTGDTHPCRSSPRRRGAAPSSPVRPWPSLVSGGLFLLAVRRRRRTEPDA